jgi:acyl carrier protein
MNRQEISTKLVRLVENLVLASREKDLKKKLSIDLSTNIYEDLAIDSLELMDLLALAEGEFNVSLEAEVLASKATLLEIADFISDKMATKR